MSLLLFWNQPTGGGTTHNAAVAFDGAGAATLVGTNENRAALALAGTGNLAAAATVRATHLGAVAFAGTCDLSAAGTVFATHFGAVALDGSGNFQPQGYVEASGTIAFGGVGEISANPTVIGTILGAVSFSGAGNLEAEGSVVPPKLAILGGGHGIYEPPEWKSRKKRKIEEEKAKNDALESKRVLDYASSETPFHDAESVAALQAERAVVKARLESAKAGRAELRLLSELRVYEALLSERLAAAKVAEQEDAAAIVLFLMSL